MKVYGYKRRDLLSEPIKFFWFLHKQIDRLRAEEDLRSLHLMAGVTSQEGVTQLQQRLTETQGQILVFQPSVQVLDVNTNPNEPDPTFEREKLEALRANIRRHGR
jgi:hypothetical protein